MKVRVAAGAVVLAVGLAGCSGESTPIQTPETVGIPGTALPIPGEGATSGPVPTEPATVPSSTSTSATSPTVATPKEIEAAVHTVRTYLDAYNAAAVDPRKNRLAEYSTPSCESCQRHIAALRRKAQRGTREDVSPLQVVKIREDFAPGRSAVVSRLNQVGGVTLDGQGAVVRQRPAEKGIQQVYYLVRDGHSWKIDVIKVYAGVV